MQNFEYDSEDMEIIEDQYQEHLNGKNEDYVPLLFFLLDTSTRRRHGQQK